MFDFPKDLTIFRRHPSKASTMSRCLSGVAVLLVLLAGIALSGVVRDGSLSAESQSNGVVIRWTSDNESGVVAYRIERSLGDGSGFITLLERLPALGSGQSYTFLDETAFKTTDTFYRYRVTPVDRDGNVIGGEQYYTGLISKKVSSVFKRTWGSIKAMFR